MNTYKKYMSLLSITCFNAILTTLSMDTPPQPAYSTTMALRIGEKIKHKVSLNYSSFIFDDFQDKDIKITESNIHQNLMNQRPDFVGKYLRPSAYQKRLEDILSSTLEICDRYGAQKCRLIHFTYTSGLAVLNNDGQHKLQLSAYLSILQKNRFSNISDINFNSLRGNEKSEIMQIIADLSQKKYGGIIVHFSRQDDDAPTNDDPEKLTALFCARETISPEDALDFLRTELPEEEDEAEKKNQINLNKTQTLPTSPIAPEAAQSTPQKDASWNTFFIQNKLTIMIAAFATGCITSYALNYFDLFPESIINFISYLKHSSPSMPSLSDLWNRNSALPETVTT